jgi:hypothetical protein
LNAIAKDLAVTLDTFAAETLGKKSGKLKVIMVEMSSQVYLTTFSAPGCFMMGREGVSHSAGGTGEDGGKEESLSAKFNR